MYHAVCAMYVPRVLLVVTVLVYLVPCIGVPCIGVPCINIWYQHKHGENSKVELTNNYSNH